jgi:hypothetical protein
MCADEELAYETRNACKQTKLTSTTDPRAVSWTVATLNAAQVLSSASFVRGPWPITKSGTTQLASWNACYK